MKLVPGILRPHHGFFAAVALGGLGALACSGTSGGGPNPATGGVGQTDGGNTSTGGTVGAGGGASIPKDLSKGGPKLRILTRTEYQNAVTDLLGTISAPLTLPDDTRLAGFASIGGAKVSLNAPSVELYEAASRAAAAEVFGDAARWQRLVGCQPKADLSDACVATFIQTFGKRAFRRSLTDAEAQRWLQVGKGIAQLATSSAAKGLEYVTAGLLQSPHFLYRVETNKLDDSIKRLKYDGASMATRLAFTLTGHPPSDTLLAAAAAGQLDTVDGIKTAVAPLLSDPKTVDRMTEFFSELSGADIVLLVDKDETTFPAFNTAVRSSMLQATQLFIKNIVLAPSADVRSLFDSNQTFVDATLAPIYGVAAPASGFAQIALGPDAGRAGILGQAAVVAGHSQPSRTSPTRRGVFISGTFLCVEPPSPPAGVITTIPENPSLTTRQRLEEHRKNPSCAACHALFDPYGMAMEHLDPIGKYRATEGTLAIDSTGALDGATFDGQAEFGAVLRQSPRALSCMMSNFYRDANAVADAAADAAQVDALGQTLAAKGYVWRDLVAEFVASDAFRSAPAPALTAGNQ
jgi:hypothetical protein